jgi:hypothetical protein
MQSGTGIQELMAAETRASQIVAEARMGELIRHRFVIFESAMMVAVHLTLMSFSFFSLSILIMISLLFILIFYQFHHHH